MSTFNAFKWVTFYEKSHQKRRTECRVVKRAFPDETLSKYISRTVQSRFKDNTYKHLKSKRELYIAYKCAHPFRTGSVLLSRKCINQQNHYPNYTKKA